MINCTRAGAVGGSTVAILPLLCYDIPWALGGIHRALNHREFDRLFAVRVGFVLQLPVRVIKIESGSDEESKFLLMVPSRQRVKLHESHWVFCRANLAIRPPGGQRYEE